MSEKSKVLKIVIIGDSTTGKSSLMERFGNNSFNADIQPNIGVDFRARNVQVNGKTYTLQILDTAGQERFNSLTRPFYKGADCCLLTFALDDMRSFENLSKWKDVFLDYTNIEDGNTFPFVIVGNKVDDVEYREVDKEIVRGWCNQNGFCPYYETSAKDATNVDEAFIAAVERYIELETTKRFIELQNRGNGVRKRHKKAESLYMKHMQGSTVDLSIKPKATSGCC